MITAQATTNDTSAPTAPLELAKPTLPDTSGYTAEAMNCCASAGKTPDGRSVICVTANAWTGEFCIEDHIALDSKYCGSAESE